MPLWLKCREPLNRHAEIFFAHAGRQPLIVTEEDQARRHRSNRREEIFRISQQNLRLRECTTYRCNPFRFGLIGRPPLKPRDIPVARDHDAELAAFGGTAQHEKMAGMQMIERAEYEDFHSRKI